MVVHARRADKVASRPSVLLATRSRAYALRCEPRTGLLRPLKEPALWTLDAQHRHLIVVARARAQLPFSFCVPARVPAELFDKPQRNDQGASLWVNQEQTKFERSHKEERP